MKTRTLVTMRVRASTTTWARVLLSAFALTLAFIVLLPSDGNYALGLLQRFSGFVASYGLPYWLVFYTAEFAANILLFVPFGVLFPIALGKVSTRVLRLTVLAGLVLSIAIELAQLMIPGRVSSIMDLIANTLGALAGVLLVSAVSNVTRQNFTRT